jgi:hypothetical protein
MILQVASSVLLGLTLLRGSPVVPRRRSIKDLILLYVAGALAAALILRFVVVMSWLRLFAMDYLISFLLISGVVMLLVSERKKWIRYPGKSGAEPSELWPAALRPGRSYGAAIAASFYVIVLVGFFSGSNFFHFTLTDGRWWRFVCIALAGYPLFLVDELVLRPLYPRWKAAGMGLLTRIFLGASIAAAVLMFNQQDAFVVLIIHLVVLFWAGLWFATELVHRQTRNGYAAALFATLIQGWAFAALFVTV